MNRLWRITRVEKRQSYNVVKYKMFNGMRIRYVARNTSDTLKVEEEDGFKLSSAIGKGNAEHDGEPLILRVDASKLIHWRKPRAIRTSWGL